MGKYQQLKGIIERAMENGWIFTDKVNYSPEAISGFFFAGDESDYVPESISGLLFGSSLGFLRALVGTGRCCHICGAGSPESHLPICSAIGLSYANRAYWVATRLVVMPDEKRIPWLFDYLFKEDR